jgi:hypothetical protein
VALRQQKVVQSAQQNNAIISSLFPSNIRDRLLVDGAHRPAKITLKRFLRGEGGPNNTRTAGDTTSMMMAEKPIADLFTDCTVMFADIAGTSQSFREVDCRD